MKKSVSLIFSAAALWMLSSCTVAYVNTGVLKENYELKMNRTTVFGKLTGWDKRKQDTYKNVKVYLNENEVPGDFETVAYGAYRPIVLPIIRPERPRIEKSLLWKAARKARKLKCDAVIVDNKNNFRVIKTKQ